MLTHLVAAKVFTSMHDWWITNQTSGEDLEDGSRQSQDGLKGPPARCWLHPHCCSFSCLPNKWEVQEAPVLAEDCKQRAKQRALLDILRSWSFFTRIWDEESEDWDHLGPLNYVWCLVQVAARVFVYFDPTWWLKWFNNLGWVFFFFFCSVWFS